jgi:YbbR domain-containing protein
MRTDFFGALRALLTTNISYKALALLVALILWVTVQSEQVVEDRARVRLEWALPEGLTLVEPPLETATATVEGVQAFLRGVRQKDLSIQIDLSKAREGEVNLDLSERVVTGIPPQVRVVSVSPGTLKVQLDRVLKRRVSVAAATTGEPARGFRVKKIAVNPARVELSGPSSVLRSIDEVPTDTVDISGLRESAELSVGLGVKKGQLTPTTPGSFVVAVEIEAIIEERMFEAVPVVIDGAGVLAEGSRRSRLVLSGSVEALDGLDKGELQVVVHVPAGTALPTDVRRGPEGLRWEVVQPEGSALEIVDASPAVLRVEAP